MLMAIDVGNTQTVLGLFAGEGLRGVWRLSSDRSRTSDELAFMVRGLLLGEGFEPAQVKEAVIGSVVPPLTAPVREMVRTLLGKEPLLVDHHLRLSVPLEVTQPSELGADRIANAHAARELYGAPVIVVDLGTAITFDVVSAAGNYVGGIIAPGLETAAEELVRRASRLPRVDLDTPPDSVIGRTTEEAMRAGLLWGIAVQVDGLVRLLWKELGVRSTVVATGGQTGVIVPLTVTVQKVEPNLTLIGLRLIHEANREAVSNGRNREGQSG